MVIFGDYVDDAAGSPNLLGLCLFWMLIVYSLGGLSCPVVYYVYAPYTAIRYTLDLMKVV
jgi:hypothetical protein